jgi:UDP-glucose 4-epimerase
MGDGKRILVAGGSGFLGRPLVDRLSAQGYDVHAVSRHGPADVDDRPTVTWWVQDLADVERTRGMLGDLRPDIVVQLTSESRGSPDRDAVMTTFRNDLQASVSLLDAAVSAQVGRMIMTTSLDEPLAKGDAATPATPYAAAKWAGAGYARMYAATFGLPTIILRPMMVYGPGQKPFKVIPATILAMLSGERATLSSGQRPLDWVYLDDVVDAFAAAIEVADPPIGPIDLGTGKLTTVRDLAEQIHEMIPGSPAPEFGARPDRPQEVVRRARTGVARQALGWEASTPLRVGLQRTIDSYRQEIPGGSAIPGTTRR